MYSFLHSEHRTENDPNRFCYSVTSPYLAEQADIWGIPQEQIEEVHLTEEHCMHVEAVLADLLPAPAESISTDVFVSESFNHGQLYNTHHVFPFLCNCLNDIAASTVIGYCGANVELLGLLSGFLERRGQREELMVDEELFTTAKAELPPGCTLVNRKEFIARSDLFIFDVGLMHLPRVEDSNNIAYPAPTEEAEVFRGKLRDAFYLCAGCEAQRLKFRKTLPRKFILLSSQHTWMEAVSAEVLTTVLTPYSSHVRYGYLKDSSRLPSLPVIPGLYTPDLIASDNLQEFLKRNVSEGEKIAAPAELGLLFPGAVYPLSETMPRDIQVDWAVIPTEATRGVDPWFREHALEKMTPVFIAGPHMVYCRANIGSPASPLSLHEGAAPPPRRSEPLIA
jgi:hypothetical protein